MSQNVRVMIFIDGSNLHWARMNYNKTNKTNLKIDFKKMLDLLAGSRFLVRAMYYCSKPIPPIDPRQIRFLDYLRNIGIQVIEKPLKTRTDLATKTMFKVEKGVDVALAVDLIGMAWEDAYDTAVLVSGDEDYLGAVNKVMSKGRNVEVSVFRNSLSAELRKAVLKITYLDDIINLIKL